MIILYMTTSVVYILATDRTHKARNLLNPLGVNHCLVVA